MFWLLGQDREKAAFAGWALYIYVFTKIRAVLQETQNSYGCAGYSVGAIDRAILYGSRAKGNYRNGSDIDLTLQGEELTLTTSFKIETELDDRLLSYMIDLSILHKISNPDLVAHIERAGLEFYHRADVMAHPS